MAGAANTGTRWVTWAAALAPILIVMATAGGYAWFARGGAGDHVSTTAAAPPGPARVTVGRDYYVLVRTLEVYPEQPNGASWDRVDDSAPDVRYDLVWQGKIVFPSPTRKNTLVALWDPVSVDVREALLGSGRLELGSTLNQGASVNITEGRTLTIDVVDEDLLGGDPIGRVEIRLDELLVGDNSFTFKPGEAGAIKRMIVRATDTDKPAASFHSTS